MKKILKVEQLEKRFGKKDILKNISFDIHEGEIFTILGPSGTGKTTLLRCITGLEDISKGCVTLKGKPLNSIPVHERNIGMVFQNAALFPHLTVEKNIKYGIREEKEYEKILRMIGMQKNEDMLPQNLSGGQAQRVALARSLAAQPCILLLDEPFAHLDAGLRKSLRRELRSILKKTKTTAIFVTHDQDEALSISDRIAVIMDGELQQIGTPEEIYAKPQTKKIAQFLGTANFIKGVRTNGGYKTEIGLVKTPTRRNEKILEFFFRPETVGIKKDKQSKHHIIDIDYFGHDLLVTVKTAQAQIINIRMLGPNTKFKLKDTVALKLLKTPHELC